MGWFLCVGKTQDDWQFYYFPTLPDFANMGRLAYVCRYRLLTPYMFVTQVLVLSNKRIGRKLKLLFMPLTVNRGVFIFL